MELQINIDNKYATAVGAPIIVCGNSDYTVKFTFDAEWETLNAKTARFVYVQNGAVQYQDVVFTGDTVSVPVMSNTKEVLIGVYAGNLCTSSPARVPCEPSIRCGTGAPADPTPSQYDQIMELLNAGGGVGGEGTPNAVQYVPQKLTEEQKAQARENIGADASGTAASAVSEHNTNDKAHNDIRLLIEGLATRLSGIADSDDTTLDQLSEIVAYIKSNKSLIDSITTSKVSVSDIINNLTSNVSNKPLSAAQGVALKALIDNLFTNKLDSTALEAAINIALEKAKESGEFDGKDGESVTVSSVKESTADGGTSVVTFSDGKTLNVKNGSKGSKGDKGDKGDTGSPGAKGDKGDDYVLTDADKQEVAILAADYIRTGGVVGFVGENNNIILSGNIADGTYTMKYQYEDGSYSDAITVEIGAAEPEPPAPTFTNFANPASSEWRTGYRLSTDIDGQSAVSGAITTNKVSVQTGDTIEVTGINFTDTNNRQAYKGNGGAIGSIAKAEAWKTSFADRFSDISYDSNSFKFTVTVQVTDMQVRFSGLGTAANVVIKIKRNGSYI